MTELVTLIERLEQIALDEHFSDPEGLEACMQERAEIIVNLQSIDTSTLEQALRTVLRARIEAVLARDAEYMAELSVRLEETRQAQEALVPGRKAIRGYGELVSSRPPAVRRIG